MDGSILGDASLSLQRMLEDEIRISFPDSSVSLESPKLAKPNSPGDMVVSLWLHRVTRHADMVNHPPRRLGTDRVEGPRLPIDLHFLATPLGGDAVTRQRLLGVTLQALHANAEVASDRLAAPLVAAGITALHLHLEPYSTEDLARLWHALSEPFELCAAYVVDFVLLPAGSQPRPAARVVDRRLRFGATSALAE
jgi:hypothetical protein